MNPLEKGLVIAGIFLVTALSVQKESKSLKDVGKCLLTFGLGYCISNIESKKNDQTKSKDYSPTYIHYSSA